MKVGVDVEKEANEKTIGTVHLWYSDHYLVSKI
jgi:hypothetical protein